MADILETTRIFKAALMRKEGAAVDRIISNYQHLYDRLQSDIDALMSKIAELDAPTVAQVRKLAQYNRLLNNIEEELVTYAQWYEVELGTHARAAITQAVDDTLKMVRLSAGEGEILSNWRELKPEIIEQLLGFLDKDGELYKRLRATAPYTREQVAKGILEGVARGYNPVKTAKTILNKMGMPLTDAIRTMRTVQLWGYREASRASYVANPEVVTGWIWYAALDTETCGACIAMHGTRHSADEVLDDHYNGRCSMIPITITNPNPDIESGIEWFSKLDEDKQREILGDSKYEAWKDGRFDLDQLTHQKDEPVYGTMRFERSLKSLLGEEDE